MARFFIDRPVFAWVVALFIFLAGALALRALPVAQYPSVAPPSVAPQKPCRRAWCSTPSTSSSR